MPRRGLGTTSRIGPRTGTIEVDWESIDNAAQGIVGAFRRCRPDDPTNKLVQPQRSQPKTVTVRDSRTGRKQTVQVFVSPSDKVTNMVEANITMLVGPEKRRDHIRILPKQGLCMGADEWKTQIRRVLGHELTHAADPSIIRREPPKAVKEYCEYVTRPHEITANLTMVRDELLASRERIQRFRKKGLLKNPAHAIALSETYREIRRCLDDKTRRRFYKVAARVWEED